MGRFEAILGPAGIVLVCVLLLGGLIRLVVGGPRRRRKAETASLDREFEEEDSEGKATLPTDYLDFATLLDRMVLPLAQAHPGWERLDGAYGVPGRPIAWFDWNGTRYALGGETHMRAMLQTWDWMQQHPGVDPLVVQHTRSGAGRLTLRPEIGWKDAKAVRIETG
ncbi:hypothetical protein [Muricoccus aerilatus]|uniref:hypothetical protein n=1 Tax=Muricoccus aerilatus TaxID=452982 RepID=UPI0005C21F79|nr:hypothetical protein [Roseomonas aerilata]